MLVIRLNKVSHHINQKVLLDDVSINFCQGEKWVLIGENGAGKTTLFNILSGKIEPEEGTVEKDASLRVGVLPQILPQSEKTAFEHTMELIFPDDAKWLIETYHDGASSESASRHEGLLHQILYEFKTHAKRLNFSIHDPFTTLSNGQQKQIVLGAIFSDNWDMILLDEPTNHLDISTISWLETQIQQAQFPSITISHDRYFADQIATGFIELEFSKLHTSIGKYQDAVKQKDERHEKRRLDQIKLARQIEREEHWMLYGVTARRKRNQLRVERLRNLRLKFEENKQHSQKSLSQHNASRSSQKIVTFNDAYIGHDQNNPLLRNLNLVIPKGAKIAINGPNGAGKSTFINTLLGKIPPLSGEVIPGVNIKIGEFTQNLTQVKPGKSVLDQISQGKTHVQFGQDLISVYRYLDAFKLGGDIAHMVPESLSGGMKQRLELALALRSEVSLLVIDEPTNNLDLVSLEFLSDFLVAFTGTLILITHDRRLMEEVVTHTLLLDGKGKWEWHVGPKLQPLSNDAPEAPSAPSKKQSSLSKEEKQKLRQIPKDIEKLEKKQRTIEQKLHDPELYDQQKFDQVRDLKHQLATLSEQIDSLYNEWEKLENKSS